MTNTEEASVHITNTRKDNDLDFKTLENLTSVHNMNTSNTLYLKTLEEFSAPSGQKTPSSVHTMNSSVHNTDPKKNSLKKGDQKRKEKTL